VTEKELDKATLEASLSTLDWWLTAFALLAAFFVVGGAVLGAWRLTKSVELQRTLTSENLALQQNIARLTVDAETAKEKTARADAYLLAEQRLTARERWRLERLESIVLPRSISGPSNLVAALKAAGLHPLNLAIVDDREASSFGIAFMTVLKDAGLLAEVTWLPKESSAPSLLVVGADDEVDRLADLLFQKFQIGQGWRAKIAAGEDPAKSDGSLKGVPAGRDCLVIGSNRDAAFQGAPGQPGEGVDEHGRPVPSPR
jgi:hypothetical protein